MKSKIDEFQTVGYGLNRPECVLAHKSGLLFAANCAENGGISVISPNGYSNHLLGTNPQKALKPNGIALEPDGCFLLAHLGTTSGGVYRTHPDGSTSAVVTHANGALLPPTNFVTIDPLGRLWITVSTTLSPRQRDYRADACTGFIALAEPGQSDARIVANNLGYTNECVIDLENAAVYVNETFGRRLTRFDLAGDGSLSNPSVLTTFSKGTYPDGLAQDEAGNLWVTSIVSNRIIKVTPEGDQHLLVEDADSALLEASEVAFASGVMSSEHLASTGNTRLKNISSLAFGGADRSTVYLGNLLDSTLYSFKTRFKGRTLSHWEVPLGYLEKYL